MTSVVGGFTQAMIGNAIGVLSAGTFRGYRFITAVASSNSMTVDQNMGFSNGGAGTLRVGGATFISTTGIPPLQSGGGEGQAVAGNVVYVRAGTGYTLTSNSITITTAGTNTQPISIIGYTTTRGDNGRPSISYGASNVNIITAQADFTIIKNFTLDGLASGQDALLVNGSGCYFENIVSRRGDDACQVGGDSNFFYNCWFKDGASAGARSLRLDANAQENVFESCVFSGSLGEGILISGDRGNSFRHCLIYGHATDGVQQTSTTDFGFLLENCIIWNNGRDGVRLTSTSATTGGLYNVHIRRCIIGSNDSGYNINYTPSDISAQKGTIQWADAHLDCNAHYTTGLGKMNQLPANSGDLTLAASPFESDTDFTFSGNASAMAILDTPCSTTLADGNSVSLYIGPNQVTSSTALASVTSLWRELTNEKNETVVPDSVVARYLNCGLNEFNLLTHYHLETATISLTAGTQEYSLPVGFVLPSWLSHAGKDLPKRSIEDYQRDGTRWREESGMPAEYAIYSQKLVLKPIPTAAAVASGSTVTLRYLSRPPDIAISGLDELSEQYSETIVYYGVGLWFLSNGFGSDIQFRGKGFMDLFMEGVQRALVQFGAKEVSP